jgi:hypothetical protein
VFIERLIEAGALEAARERLDQALKRFPDDAELQSLDARIDAPRPPSETTPETS